MCVKHVLETQLKKSTSIKTSFTKQIKIFDLPVKIVARPVVCVPFTFVTSNDTMASGWFTYVKNDVLSPLGCMPCPLEGKSGNQNVVKSLCQRVCTSQQKPEIVHDTYNKSYCIHKIHSTVKK